MSWIVLDFPSTVSKVHLIADPPAPRTHSVVTDMRRSLPSCLFSFQADDFLEDILNLEAGLEATENSRIMSTTTATSAVKEAVAGAQEDPEVSNSSLVPLSYVNRRNTPTCCLSLSLGT